MKKPILCLVGCLMATPALAQPADGPDAGVGGSLYTYNQAASATPSFGSHYTPTMQRQELILAVALREEAAALLAANGGTLSPRDRRYIRRKAERILGY